MKTTFEIIFDCNELDLSMYAEASMISKNSIVVDADSRYAIPCGNGQVRLSINGQFKLYDNVWAVAPYVYND